MVNDLRKRCVAAFRSVWRECTGVPGRHASGPSDALDGRAGYAVEVLDSGWVPVTPVMRSAAAMGASCSPSQAAVAHAETDVVPAVLRRVYVFQRC